MAKVVLIVVGTRPEVIKMAPIYLAMKQSDRFDPILLSSGQHHEMLNQAFVTFGIKPDYDLGLMMHEQRLSNLTARVLTSISDFIEGTQPDALLVQGDTCTAMASALAAFYQHIPVGHVEAGLRTYNVDSPWPEEVNRRIIAPLARWHFVPTKSAAENLKSEHIESDLVFVTGNTVIDSLFLIKERLTEEGDFIRKLFCPRFFDMYLKSNSDRHWILVTGHRRESFGDGFDRICSALKELLCRYKDLGIVFPLHLNPSVRGPIKKSLGDHSRIALIDPVDYQSFVWLMSHCRFVLSDSGGVQEEAPSLGKPVLVMREHTERVEGIEAVVRLVGSDVDKIVIEASLLLDNEMEYSKRAAISNPYGDGKSARRVVKILDKDLNR